MARRPPADREVPADRRSARDAADRDPDDGDGPQEPRRDPDGSLLTGSAPDRRSDRRALRGRRGGGLRRGGGGPPTPPPGDGPPRGWGLRARVRAPRRPAR